MEWDRFFEWLMDREGRAITNDPRDKGGQTCWGISRRHHPFWIGWAQVDRGAPAKQIEPLVRDFYREMLGQLWDGLPPRLRDAVCDAAVNMGAQAAGKLLQRALNLLAGTACVSEDGKVGPRTMDAVRHQDAAALAIAVCAVRMARYSEIVAGSPDQKVFLAGWLNRVRLLMSEI